MKFYYNKQIFLSSLAAYFEFLFSQRAEDDAFNNGMMNYVYAQTNCGKMLKFPLCFLGGIHNQCQM